MLQCFSQTLFASFSQLNTASVSLPALVPPLCTHIPYCCCPSSPPDVLPLIYCLNLVLAPCPDSFLRLYQLVISNQWCWAIRLLVLLFLAVADERIYASKTKLRRFNQAALPNSWKLRNSARKFQHANVEFFQFIHTSTAIYTSSVPFTMHLQHIN